MVTAMIENKYNFCENVENEAMLVCNQNYNVKKKTEKIFRIKKKWCIKWAKDDIRMKNRVHDKNQVTKIVKFIFKPSYSKYLNEKAIPVDVFKNYTQLANNINSSMNGHINNSRYRNTNNANISNNNTGAEHSISSNNAYNMSSSSISANMPHTSNTFSYVEDNVLDNENEYDNEFDNECTSDGNEYIHNSNNYTNDDNTKADNAKAYILQKQFPAASDYCEVKMGGTNQRETLDSMKRRYKTLYGNQPFLPGFCFIYEIKKHHYEFCEDCFKAVVS